MNQSYGYLFYLVSCRIFFLQCAMFILPEQSATYSLGQFIYFIWHFINLISVRDIHHYLAAV